MALIKLTRLPCPQRELHEGEGHGLPVPQPAQKRGSIERVEVNVCLGQSAAITIDRGVYDSGCEEIEDGFHQLHLEQSGGRAKGSDKMNKNGVQGKNIYVHLWKHRRVIPSKS